MFSVGGTRGTASAVAVSNWLACLVPLFSASRMGTTQPRKQQADCPGIDHRPLPPVPRPTARHITRGIDHAFTWMGSSRPDDAGSNPVLGKI